MLMKESMTRSYRMAKELSVLFELGSKMDTMLSVSLYYLNQLMGSERSSIWLFQHWNQKLTIFSSLDLEKNEVSIPKSCGVAGWVFVNRKAAVVNNTHEDSRFCKDIDEITGFQTRKLICTPLIDFRERCLGTLQSLNKLNEEEFTNDDLDLLNLAARMVAAAINNSKRYNELLVTNEDRSNFINRISDNIN
jgi:GAF domain-containing protein